MKFSIDEQIEAVELVSKLTVKYDDYDVAMPLLQEHLAAALSTLRWVKRYTKPSLDALMAEFPGARVKQREEE